MEYVSMYYMIKKVFSFDLKMLVELASLTD